MCHSSFQLANKAVGRHYPLATVAVALLAIPVASCNYGPSRVQPPSISASGSAAKAMEMYDGDGDGFLSAAELDKVPGLKAALATLDTDNDGKVSADEIEARIEAWQATRIGIAGGLFIVTRGGKPL